MSQINKNITELFQSEKEYKKYFEKRKELLSHKTKVDFASYHLHISLLVINV